MDTLSEHYSYVSNVSGGDLSKPDTFVFPEPKKRLFDSTDDLDMSVIPNQIKQEVLTHIILVSYFWDIGKQYSPR